MGWGRQIAQIKNFCFHVKFEILLDIQVKNFSVQLVIWLWCPVEKKGLKTQMWEASMNSVESQGLDEVSRRNLIE